MDQNLIDSVEKMGFEEATPIQEETIPLALEGKDVIGQAQTGTGKTAAYGLPMLNDIDINDKNVQGLVIAPTRELAIQIQDELFQLGKFKKARIVTVYGGANIGQQIKQIKKGAQIVVGTPGRMLDHISRKTLKLNQIKTLVLDEADEMLNMGFIEDIEKIISSVPEQRQTLLFSATMPKPIQKIAERFMKSPEVVKIKTKTVSADSVTQYYTKAKDFEKFDIMCRLLDVQAPKSALVFARTKKRVDEVAKGLEIRGYNSEGIHGDLSQRARISVLNNFKKGNVDILVATDVAARGIDVEGLTHVYNFDVPQDPESYVHRIGRTGRAGQKGEAITFVTPQEMGYLKTIENLTKQQMSPLRPPTDSEAVEGQIKVAMEKIDSLINQDQDKAEKYQSIAKDLRSVYSEDDLALALVRSIVKDPDDEVEVKITPQRPLPNKNKGSRNRGGKGRGKGKGGRSRRGRNNNRGRGNSQGGKGRNQSRGGKRNN